MKVLTHSKMSLFFYLVVLLSHALHHNTAAPMIMPEKSFVLTIYCEKKFQVARVTVCGSVSSPTGKDQMLNEYYLLILLP